MKGILFILSAPSGTGKTSLTQELIKRLHQTYWIDRVITYTTKLPRPKEREGIDYYFLSEVDFIQKLQDNFFLEHSKAYGFYYGSPRSILNGLNEGKSYILVIDRVGAASIKSSIRDSRLIWIKPPNFDALVKRLIKRDQDTQADIEYRLKLAQEELALEEQNPLFDYTIINDTFDVAVQELESIIVNEFKKRN